MANYESFYRTNYFKVKDADQFKKFMALASSCSEDLTVYENDNHDGTYMICGYGEPSFYAENIRECFDTVPQEIKDKEPTPEEFEKFLKDNNIEDSEDDIFFDVLQALIAEDDAVIYKEAGHEKMRYIGVCVGVITTNKIAWVHVDDELMGMARNMLQNPEWNTKLEY